MTALTIHCPLCNGPLQIDASVAGQQVHCPLCQGLLQLPPWEELMGMPPGSFPQPPPSLPPPPPASPWGPPADQSFALPPPPPSSEPPPGYWPPSQEIPMGVPVGMAVATQPAPQPTPQFPPPQYPPPTDIPRGIASPMQPPVPEAPAALGMACPACSSRFEVRPEFAGQTIRCPHCAREMALPKAELLTGMLRPLRRNFPLAIIVEKQKPAAATPVAEKPSSPSKSPPRKTEPLPPKLNPSLPPPAVNLPPAASPPEASTPAAAPSGFVAAEHPAVDSPVEPTMSSPTVAASTKRVVDLLPPGASADPPLADAPLAAGESALPPAFFPTAADVLLPPGTEAGAVVQPGEERALPTLAAPELPGSTFLPNASAPKSAPGTVVLPTADGRYMTVRDAPKTVGHGDEEVELRRLTDEEKSRRRFVRNFILVLISLAIIGITFFVMMPRTGT